MPVYSVNDHIRILTARLGSPNSVGRITGVLPDGVLVTNLNMPYMGTYVDKFFPYAEITKD